MITVPAEIRLAIERHAENCHPEECCGLIASDRDGQIRFVYPLSNNDRSGTSFTIDPEESYRAFLHTDKMGWEISGLFHSHPNGPNRLSDRDIAEASETWIHFLSTPSGLTAFRVKDGKPTEITMVTRTKS